MSLTASLVCIVSVVGSIGGEVSLIPIPQAKIRLITNAQSCPVDLSSFREEIELLLESVSDEAFKKTIRESLKASIPQAIHQADGINPQMAFLRKEIIAQDQIRKDAEEIARVSTDNLDDALTPCSAEEKGSYCNAVEQYYIASASNVANRGFLAALECYKKNGVL